MTDRAEPSSDVVHEIGRSRPHRALLTGFSAVLDSNVLSNATIRDFILNAADRALFRPVWSADILNEVRRTLLTFSIMPARVDYILANMSDAFPEACVTGYNELLPSMAINEKDRHVLGAAVVGRAEVIVTNNLRHFPKSALSVLGIEPMNADDFLRDLLDIEPERMVEVLTTIKETRRHPPKSIPELLDALGRNGCPDFATELEEAVKETYPDS